MPGPHKGVSTQRTNQQVLAKPRHQPSERDQQARERLRQKAKIKSHAYIQLGEKVLVEQLLNSSFIEQVNSIQSLQQIAPLHAVKEHLPKDIITNCTSNI